MPLILDNPMQWYEGLAVLLGGSLFVTMTVAGIIRRFGGKV